MSVIGDLGGLYGASPGQNEPSGAFFEPEDCPLETSEVLSDDTPPSFVCAPYDLSAYSSSTGASILIDSLTCGIFHLLVLIEQRSYRPISHPPQLTQPAQRHALSRTTTATDRNTPQTLRLTANICEVANRHRWRAVWAQRRKREAAYALSGDQLVAVSGPRSCTQLINEFSDTINRLLTFWKDTGCKLPYVQHSFPNLQDNINPGSLGSLGQAGRIRQQDFICTYLNQQGW